MKNEKGFTLIELISSFVLISLIVALLFEVLFIVKNLYSDSGIKTELLIKQALISEKINEGPSDLRYCKTLSSLNKTRAISF